MSDLRTCPCCNKEVERNDIINGKLIVTGKLGYEPRFPFATLVFRISDCDLIDCECYMTEKDVMVGHDNIVNYFSEN